MWLLWCSGESTVDQLREDELRIVLLVVIFGLVLVLVVGLGRPVVGRALLVKQFMDREHGAHAIFSRAWLKNALRRIIGPI